MLFVNFSEIQEGGFGERGGGDNIGGREGGREGLCGLED